MSGLPICWINTSSYIWTPVQHPAPLVVRQVCYLGGKLFITFIKLKEVVHREELSPLGETAVHYEAKAAHPAKAEDEWQAWEASCSVSHGYWWTIVCAIRSKWNYKRNQSTGKMRPMRTDAEGQQMSKLTLNAPLWWSFLQPQGDICAPGVHSPDAPDGPCKLHRIWMPDTLSNGQMPHPCPHIHVACSHNYTQSVFIIY